MATMFTGGVPQTLATLASFLTVYKSLPILGYFNQLRHDFMLWMIDCKKAGTIPHVYIDISGPCVNWYRSDTGEIIFRTTIHTDRYLMKTVHFAASFGVIIDNAWHGDRGERSGTGWWYDVPERDPMISIPFTDLSTSTQQVAQHA